jgi:hypothetical protein
MQESGVTIFFVSHDPSAIRALCSRALLLNAGHVVSDGKPIDVLNRYQKIIMAREEAFAADSPSPASAEPQESLLPAEESGPVRYTYRHGDGSAEILRVELLDESRQPLELVETGQSLCVRLRLLFHADVQDPVCGFMIRNRHGIHLYGTNTQLQELNFGPVRRGEVVEVTFAFNCWLAPDSYSLAVAAHSPDAISFDWLDGAYFFQVMSGRSMEGVANLNASVVTRRVGFRPSQSEAETINA